MSKNTDRQQRPHPQRNANLGHGPQQQHDAKLPQQKRKVSAEDQAFDDVQPQRHKRQRVASGYQASYSMHQVSNGMTGTPCPDSQQRHPEQQRPQLLTGLRTGLEGRVLPPRRQPVSNGYQPPGSTNRSLSGRVQLQQYQPQSATEQPLRDLQQESVAEGQSSTDTNDDGDNDAEECLYKMRSDFQLNDLTNAFEAFIDKHQEFVLDYLKPALEAFIDSNPEVVSEYLQPAFQSFINRMARSFATGTSDWTSVRSLMRMLPVTNTAS
ncbi:hypothetical protein LTR17_003745 [Elasticomyces elasticus]|nr:hypothetical protein LTR17_003745 [Elasticomyces elasticus]